MAKINFGGGVTDMRGKLAGNAYSRNKSGAYVRAKVTPVNPNTVRQSEVRALFGSLSAAWRTLSDAERQSFIDQSPNYPKTDIFGNAIQRSGQQLYMHLNQQLIANGSSPISTCPPPVEVEAFTVGSTTLDVSLSSFGLFGTGTVPAGTQLIIEASQPMSAGVSNPGTKYRTIDSNAVENSGTVNLATTYAAVFGAINTIPVGSKVCIRWYTMSTTNGQTSAYTNIVATAE